MKRRRHRLPWDPQEFSPREWVLVIAAIILLAIAFGVPPSDLVRF